MDDPQFPQKPAVPLALLIDLDALAHNYHTVQACLKKGTVVGAVLKANAGGVGIKEAGARLYKEGCRHFFLAYVTEAIELKPFVGDDSFIYVLSGLRRGDEEVYAHYNLIPVLSDVSQVQLWNVFARSKNKCLKAVLHVDTGLTRTGLSAEEVKTLSLLDISNIEIVCIMSHLACSAEATHPMNEAQRLCFDALRQRFHTIPASFVSSAGVMISPAYHYDIVRTGLALVGCVSVHNPALRPVIQAYGQVMQIHQIQPGTTVGYGADFVAQRPSRIATIGVGYADGYFRSLGNKGDVYFRGYIIPVVGRISMDFTTLDVTDVPIEIGDWVELFGDHISAHQVATQAGTISWELLSRLGTRFERFYRGT